MKKLQHTKALNLNALNVDGGDGHSLLHGDSINNFVKIYYDVEVRG